MFSDGSPNNQGADAEVSAVRPSVGTTAGHQDDLPEVQKSSLGPEAVSPRAAIGPPVCREHTDGPEPSTRVSESAIYL
jgi:hypothetical protein